MYANYIKSSNLDAFCLFTGIQFLFIIQNIYIYYTGMIFITSYAIGLKFSLNHLKHDVGFHRGLLFLFAKFRAMISRNYVSEHLFLTIREF